ncbi:hypothetical protein ACWGLF_39810 [Streptomyces puniciscabiei]
MTDESGRSGAGYARATGAELPPHGRTAACTVAGFMPCSHPRSIRHPQTTGSGPWSVCTTRVARTVQLPSRAAVTAASMVANSSASASSCYAGAVVTVTVVLARLYRPSTSIAA